MNSTLIVARMQPQSAEAVAEIFSNFDRTDMPHHMGTLRRELFTYHGLYFHLQDFADDHGSERVQHARTDSRFIQISDDLKPFIQAYDSATWRSPADAMAARFYRWQA